MHAAWDTGLEELLTAPFHMIARIWHGTVPLEKAEVSRENAQHLFAGL
jgi:hypothetical protein